MISNYPFFARSIQCRPLPHAVLVLSALWLAVLPQLRALTLTDADVCVYGGTSGGVAAAVQAARMGKRAVLVESGGHLGGMSSSGLGVTDVGPGNVNTYIGGVSREFYKRVGAKYGKSEQVWFNDKKLWFEPKVAELVFNEMVAEAGVVVVFNEALESVVKNGTEITRLITTGGRIVRAGMFIDATYEGDLLAAAGATWVIGREANSQYDETLNGVRVLNDVVSGQTVDPYVIPGNASSGLIYGVKPGPAAAPGSGDALLQAYNYRLCLTNNASNRLPIDPPLDYNVAEYELEARYVIAKGGGVTLNNLIDVQQLIPGNKTDINNSGPVSTDLPGGNDGYVTASPAQRTVIAARHERYMRGLLYFLRTNPRVPASVRNEMATWGLCADEFTDNGGWPRQLYVREARRMVSDFVMTDKHGKGTWVAPENIGLANYWLDSHDYQLLNIGGKVKHEGSFFTSSPLYPPAPFPIAFRFIVAKRTEVTNLAAPFCLSATHACFASLRMEPVFMLTSQAAATAAVLALESGTPIQDVPYDRLRNHLLADGQVLSLTAPPPPPSGVVVVDTENAGAVTITGNWNTSTSSPGYQGAHYLHDGNADKGAKSVLFRPNLATAGNYTVAIAYRAFTNRATNVPVTITHAGGTANLTVNQTLEAGAWLDLGTFAFNAGTHGTLLLSNTGTGNFVIADAVRWSPNPPLAGGPQVTVLARDAVAGETGVQPAQLALTRATTTASPLTIHYSVGGTATAGVDFASLSGNATIAANSATVAVPVYPLTDALAEGDESIIVSITPSGNYSATPGFDTATITLRDAAYQEWRFGSFPGGQANDHAVSGVIADPEADGLRNEIEWALGTGPLASTPSPVTLSFSPAGMDLSFTQRRGLPSGTLMIETSADFADWQPAPPSVTLVGIQEVSPATDLLTYRWPSFELNGPRLFIRLQVGP